MFKNTIHVFCHPKPTLPNYFKGEKLFKIYMKQFIESEDEWYKHESICNAQGLEEMALCDLIYLPPMHDI